MLLEHIGSLRKPVLRKILEDARLPKSGTRNELRVKIALALDGGDLTAAQLVEVLDEVQPWGKQHVLLYGEPSGVDTTVYRDRKKFKALLAKHSLDGILDKSIALIVPPKMQLARIEQSPTQLRVTAVCKRTGWERKEEMDQQRPLESGRRIEMRAFMETTMRGMVVFEWDLKNAVATLQITQLPRHGDYDGVAAEFYTLVSNWLDLTRFPLLDISTAIATFHKMERDGDTSVRSHGIYYDTPSGCRLAASTLNGEDGVIGQADYIDKAMDQARNEGTGHMSNLYFKPNGHAATDDDGDDDEEDLEDDANSRRVHVVLMAQSNRLNFKKAATEEKVRDVLKRVREACG